VARLPETEKHDPGMVENGYEWLYSALSGGSLFIEETFFHSPFTVCCVRDRIEWAEAPLIRSLSSLMNKLVGFCKNHVWLFFMAKHLLLLAELGSAVLGPF
jgi:hypothetical protein